MKPDGQTGRRRRARRTPAIEGITLSWADYVSALKANTLSGYGQSRHAWPPHACPRCTALNATGVRVIYRGKERCPGCVPADRTCRECERTLPLTAFDVRGGRVESYCEPCRRQRENARYHRLQAEQRRERAEVMRCARCGDDRPGDEFYGDQRYRTALLPICRRCRNTP